MKIVKPKKAFVIIHSSFCECSRCRESGIGYLLRSCPFCGIGFGGYVIGPEFTDPKEIEGIKTKIGKDRPDLHFYGRKKLD